MTPGSVMILTRRFLPHSMTWIRDEIALAPAEVAMKPVCWLRESSELAVDIELGVDPLVLGTRGMLHGITASRSALRFFAERLPSDTSAIHAHFLGAGMEIANVCAALGLPLTITCHGYDIGMRPRQLARQGAAHCGQVVLEHLRGLPNVKYHSVSATATEAMVRRGISPGDIEEIALGIDARRFELAGAPVRDIDLIFVGRFVDKKDPLGFLDLVEDISAVKNVRTVMIGTGPLLANAKRSATERNLPVAFEGAATPGQVSDLLNRSKVLCLPSKTPNNGDLETFGLVLVEAMAAGAVPVAFAVGGAVEALAHGGGVLVPPGDRWSLAVETTELLMEEHNRAELAEEGKMVVETYYDARCQVPRIVDYVLG